jgi:hypothetical protein
MASNNSAQPDSNKKTVQSTNRTPSKLGKKAAQPTQSSQKADNRRLCKTCGENGEETELEPGTKANIKNCQTCRNDQKALEAEREERRQALFNETGRSDLRKKPKRHPGDAWAE